MGITGTRCGPPSGRTVVSHAQPPPPRRADASDHGSGCVFPTSVSATVPLPVRDIASGCGGCMGRLLSLEIVDEDRSSSAGAGSRLDARILTPMVCPPA